MINPISIKHDEEHPYINILDVIINVYGSKVGYTVEVLHKPTNIIIKESGTSIHKTRCAAMQQLNNEVKARVIKKNENTEY